MTSSKQDMDVVPADDDLVERLLNRALGPDWEQSHEEAFAAGVEHARASLSSELARCRNALGEKDDA